MLGLICTQKQARKLISGLNPTANTRLLSFNRAQSMVVIDLFIGHPNTLRRCLHSMGLTNSQLRKRRGAEEETSAHVLFECEALASLRHTYLGSFFLDPQDIKRLNLGAIWNFRKGTGLP